jgi:hypothetical protein
MSPVAASPDYNGGAGNNGRHPESGPICTWPQIRAEFARRDQLARARSARYRQRKKERDGQLRLFGFALPDDTNTSTNEPLTRKS